MSCLLIRLLKFSIIVQSYSNCNYSIILKIKKLLLLTYCFINIPLLDNIQFYQPWKMSIPNRQKFMQVKEKLDYHRLPTSFPPQATSIISKLLQKIQQKQSKLIDRTTESIRSNPLSPRNYSSSQSLINENERTIFILETKIKKLLKQNSLLNQEVLQAKQFIQVLKECKFLKQKCDKLQLKSPRSTDPINNQLISLRNGFDILKAREIQLFQQLTHVKYKYNELMQFLHENPNNQKQYIKRLLKYKKLQISTETNQRKQTIKNIVTTYQTDLNTNKITLNQMDINKVIAQNHKLSSLNKTLKLKVQNREIQILRLQTKLIDQFNVDSLVQASHLEQKNTQINALKNQIQLLLAITNSNKINHDQNKNFTNIKSIKQNQKNQQKSPDLVKNIKSPPKNQNNLQTIDKKNQATQKQRKSVKSPETINNIQSLKRENQTFKQQIQNLKKQLDSLKRQAKCPLKNKVLKESLQKSNSNDEIVQQRTKLGKKTFQQQKGEIQNEKNINTNKNMLILLKAEIFEKNLLIKEMQQRLDQSQKENQNLAEKLKEMKFLFERNSFQKDNFSVIKAQNAKGKFNVYRKQKQTLMGNNSQQYGNHQFQKPATSKSTNFYSTSQQQKFQRKDDNHKYNLSKLNTEIQINRASQNNINSRISSQKQQKQDQRNLQDISQQVSQQKSYLSKQKYQQQQKQNLIKNKSKGFTEQQIQSSQQKIIQGSGKAVIIIPQSKSKKQTLLTKESERQGQKVQQIQNEQNQPQINYQTIANDTAGNQSVVSSDSDFIKTEEIQGNNINGVQRPKDFNKQEKKRNEQQLMKQFEQQQSKYEQRIFILESKLAQLEQENQQLKNLLNSGNELKHEIEEQKYQYEQKIKDLSLKLINFQDERCKLFTRIKQKEHKITSLQQQLHLNSNKIAQLNDRVKNHQQTFAQLKQIKSNHDNKDDINQFYKQQFPSNKKQDTSVQSLKQDVQNLSKQLSNSQQTITELSNFLQIQKKQKETLYLQKIRIQKRNDFLKAKLLQLQKFIKIQAQQMVKYRNVFGF